MTFILPVGTRVELDYGPTLPDEVWNKQGTIEDYSGLHSSGEQGYIVRALVGHTDSLFVAYRSDFNVVEAPDRLTMLSRLNDMRSGPMMREFFGLNTLADDVRALIDRLVDLLSDDLDAAPIPKIMDAYYWLIDLQARQKATAEWVAEMVEDMRKERG